MLLPKRIIRSKKSKYVNILEKYAVIDINKADELVSKCFIGTNEETVKIITSIDENNEVIHTMYIGDKKKIIPEIFYKKHLDLMLTSDEFEINNINIIRENNNLFYKYQKKIKRNTNRKNRTSKKLTLTNKRTITR